MRDTAVGYFAGVREVLPMATTYIYDQDPDVFTFSNYDPSQWALTDIQALDSGPITTTGRIYTILNPTFDRGLDNWDQTLGEWAWTGSAAHGHWNPGSATVVADGNAKELHSSPIDVTPGTHLEVSVWVQWAGVTAVARSSAVQLRALYYLDDVYVSSSSATLSYTSWPASTPSLNQNFWAQVSASVLTGNSFTVPAGANRMRLSLVVTGAASQGQFWFDTVEMRTTDNVTGTVYKDFQTTSQFAKVKCAFTDSGLVRSNDMWQREDPLDLNISNTALAYYTGVTTIPPGTWGDSLADWADSVITWGAPRSLVAITVDPDRMFQNKRVLHFTRAAGGQGVGSEAGVKVRQWTNFVAGGMARIGCVFLKPVTNNNQITIRLRRVSDGVYIYTETFTPTVNFWYEHVSDFFEIPTTREQEYTVELMCTGDQVDELYLNDLYCEIANVRYFVRLGGEGAFLHDVTPLRYADSAIVSCTEPVREFSVAVAILSPRAFAYSCSLAPVYLQ